MAVPLSVAFILGLLGQTVTSGGAHETPAARLDFMKASLKIHAVDPADDSGTIFKLGSEPVMRFTNPVGTVKDGAIFYLDRRRRAARGRGADLPPQQRNVVPGVLVALDRAVVRGPAVARVTGRCRAQSHPGAHRGPRRLPSYGFARSAP